MKKPMLATKYKPSLVRYPCYVQPKLNGIRALYQNGEFASRELCLFHPSVVEHLLMQLRLLLPFNVCLDGEFYKHGWSLQRINSAISVVRKEPSEFSKDIEYHVFDYQDKLNPFDRRYTQLITGLPWNRLSHIKLVPAALVSTDVEPKIYQSLIAEGYEGMMYRIGGNLYQDGRRARTLLKRKDWLDDEFEIVGIKEGKENEIGSRLVGTMGAITCKTKSGVEFDIGSGFTDKQRNDVWLGGLIVGKLAKIKYEMLSDTGIPLKPVCLAILD